MFDIIQEIRFAARRLGRSAGFTLAAVLMLALGAGANTAVFSVVNSLLLRPLPFAAAERLVWISDTNEKDGLSGMTYAVEVFEEFKRNSKTFEDMTAYFAFFGYGSFKLTGQGETERFAGVQVAPNFFSALGVRPVVGRDFTPEECKPNGPKVVLLSHGLWQRRFGGSAAIVGQTLALNNEAVTVIGVLGPEFDFSSTFVPGTSVDLYVPAIFDVMRNWGNVFSVVGRLKPGMTVDTARAEFQTLVPQLNAAHRNWGSGVAARLTPLAEHVSGRMQRSLIVLWGAVGVVLLIVCTNLANLMLARAASRSKETAVRIALGAGRMKLMRPFLAEGVLLAIAGAGLGVPLAYLFTRYIKTSANLDIPLLYRVEVDSLALTFTIAASILTALAAAVLPAFRLGGRSLQGAGRGSIETKRSAWVRSALVVAEVALACMLLITTGLLLRSFMRLLDVDLGFRPSNAVAVRVDPNGAPDASDPRAQRINFLDEAVRRVSTIPGVEVAGLTDALPFDRNRSWGIRARGQSYRPGESPEALVYVTGPGYLKAMGIPLRRGRDFNDEDKMTSPAVMIVNEAVARLLWPGQDAVGQTAITGRREYLVVGVVADVRDRSVEQPASLQMYLSHRQNGQPSVDLVVRSHLSQASLTASLRGTLKSLDSAMAVNDVRPIDRFVDRAVSPRKFLLWLLAAFGFVALALASLGIYGVVSYGVNQRVAEIGVRMALGATASNVRGYVIKGAVGLALMGGAAGTVVSLVAARFISTLLFGTSPFDWMAFLASAAVLTAVAAISAYLPAERASRLDPAVALRT